MGINEFFLQSSGDAGADVGNVVPEELGEAEVGEFGGEIGIEENVAGLDIAMNDVGTHFFVEVANPLRDS